MRRSESTRLYIRANGGQYARLLWVRNNRPNEMLLGFYGLDGRPARVVREFPERIISPEDTGPYHFKWTDAPAIDIPLDHFSCHADGRFHLKRRRGGVLYSHDERHATPLGPDTDVFLDLIVVSGPIHSYAVIEGDPTPPNAWIEGPPDATVGLKCLFAGINYPVEDRALRILTGRSTPGAAVRLESGTLKGMIVASTFPLPEEAAAAHPGGTTITFRWQRDERLEGYKSFVLR